MREQINEMVGFERMILAKLMAYFGIFNVGQYPSYYWLSLICYQYMYNQGAAMKKLQVQVIYCEYMSRTWS